MFSGRRRWIFILFIDLFYSMMSLFEWNTCYLSEREHFLVLDDFIVLNMKFYDFIFLLLWSVADTQSKKHEGNVCLSLNFTKQGSKITETSFVLCLLELCIGMVLNIQKVRRCCKNVPNIWVNKCTSTVGLSKLLKKLNSNFCLLKYY